MPELIIADLTAARALMSEDRSLWALSLLDPGSRHWPVPGSRVKWHARVAVSDIEDHRTSYPPPWLPPQREHAEQIVDFASRWDRRTDVMIHCAQGRSRSAAAALTFLAIHGPTDPIDLGLMLRRAGPCLTPNRLLVWHADQVLNRAGSLLVALGAMRDATQRGVLEPVRVKLTRGSDPSIHDHNRERLRCD